MALLGTLTTAIPAESNNVTSLAVTALAAPVAVGDSLALSGGGYNQTVTASAAAAKGATSISTNSFNTGAAALPVGTTVSDSSVDSAVGRMELQGEIPVVGAGLTVVTDLGEVPVNASGELYVGKVFAVSSAAVAASDTNFFTFTVAQLRAGVVTNTVATQTTKVTGGAALVADTPLEFALTDPNPFAVQAGDEFRVTVVSTGTAASTDAQIKVTVEIQ